LAQAVPQRQITSFLQFGALSTFQPLLGGGIFLARSPSYFSLFVVIPFGVKLYIIMFFYSVLVQTVSQWQITSFQYFDALSTLQPFLRGVIFLTGSPSYL